MTLPVNSGERPNARALLADVPAFGSAAWLPSGVWVELDERAVTHARLLDARREVVAEATATAAGYRAEDAAYQEAMTSGFLSDADAKLPTMTSREEREAVRREFRERAVALDSALVQFIKESIAAIEEHAEQWLGDLANRREVAAERRREAERLLIEARAEELRTARLEHWTKLNAGVHERASFRLPERRHVTFTHIVESYTPRLAEPSDPDALELVDPPALPYWDEDRRARMRQIAAQEAEGAPRDEAEALRQAIEEPPDPARAAARTARIEEVAHALDNNEPITTEYRRG